MGKINIYETEQERFRRERSEAIVKEYLAMSDDILRGVVTPNRVVNYLATRFSMSGYGIKTVLKRMGVYKSAKQPVIRKGLQNPVQATIPFSQPAAEIRL